MQEFQNALYINLNDPTNAVIFDRDWLKMVTQQAGLRICRIEPPEVRGFHWHIQMERARPDNSEHAVFPDDEAPIGRRPPPLLAGQAHRLGL